MTEELEEILRDLDRPFQFAPTDAMIQMLRDQAAEFGFVLSGRCRHCQRPISALRSLKNRSGPVCAAKHKKNDAGDPAKNHASAATNTDSKN